MSDTRGAQLCPSSRLSQVLWGCSCPNGPPPSPLWAGLQKLPTLAITRPVSRDSPCSGSRCLFSFAPQHTASHLHPAELPRPRARFHSQRSLLRLKLFFETGLVYGQGGAGPDCEINGVIPVVQVVCAVV